MKTIGKYQVVEEIGHSAAGATYRARDAFRKRELALKVLSTLDALSVEAKDQLYAHLGACAELSHRNIAKIQDVGEADGGVYVATELLAGTDLRSHLAGPPSADNPHAALAQHLTLMAQVCEGLAGAHARGIAHGNIKPGNIFVIDGRDAVILDFGVGYLQSLLIAAGTRLEGLLPNYLAPEQILGDNFDARSDLFSFAMLLYEVLAGRYPFDAPAGVIPREIVHSELRPLRELNPLVPQELEQTLIHALKKDPTARLDSAKELAASLYSCAQQLRRQQSAPAVETPAPAPTAFQTPAKSEQAPTAERAPTIEPPLPVHVDLVPPAALIQPEQPAPPSNRTAPIELTVPPVSPPPRPQPANIAPIPGKPAPVAPRRHPAVKSTKLQRSIATLIVAAALAFWATATIISRSSLKASQQNVSAPVIHTPVSPASNAAPAPPSVPIETAPQPKPGPPAAVIEKPAPPFTSYLRSRVQTLWEAGRYADALDIVDNFLAESPANAEAQGWKKRIRAAQDAEAAIK